jgi:Arc/MetJ-type ribon-helix-helix transcriptional regulator
MKLSVSLSDDDVAVLDDYVKKSGLASRSAGVQRAVQLLRYPDLEDDYAAAWTQWTGDDEQTWEIAVDDGVTDASR